MEFEGWKALVVDGDAVSRMLLQKQLAALGFAVAAAAGAAEAEDAARASDCGPFDLVVLDMESPDMDGALLEKRIRTLPGGRSARIIVTAAAESAGLSAENAGLQAENVGLRAGSAGLRAENVGLRDVGTPKSDGVLPKPIVRSDLEALVRRIFGSGGGPEKEDEPWTDLPGVDMQDAKERLNGRWDIYKDVLGVFLSDNCETDEAIRGLAAAGDLRAVKSRAHALKGAAANISAPGLRRAAHDVELAAKTNDGEALEEALFALEAELRNLCVAAGGLRMD